MVSEFTIADVRQAAPGVSDGYINKLLGELKNAGRIEPLGTGRGARWPATDWGPGRSCETRSFTRKRATKDEIEEIPHARLRADVADALAKIARRLREATAIAAWRLASCAIGGCPA
jgi:hypothetical protein